MDQGSSVCTWALVMREEQWFPSSLPDPFSYVLQLSEKTWEDGELFFQCIPPAMEPHTMPLPEHPPEDVFPPLEVSLVTASIATLCLPVPLFPIPVSDHR